MNLDQFQEHYKISPTRRKKDSLDEPLLMGKFEKGLVDKDRPEAHHHVYDVDGTLYAYFNYPTRARANSARKQLIGAGALSGSIGEEDFIMVFDPENITLSKLVIRLAGIRIKKIISDEQRAAMKARLVKKA